MPNWVEDSSVFFRIKRNIINDFMYTALTDFVYIVITYESKKLKPL